MELINNIPSIVKEVLPNNCYKAYQIEGNELKLNSIQTTDIRPMTIEECQEFFKQLVSIGYYYTSREILKMPKVGTPYHYISIDRHAKVECAAWTGNQQDIERFSIGNCFLTEESVYDAVAIFKEPFVTNAAKFLIRL